MGYSRKKTNRGGLRTYFFEPPSPLGIFSFFTLLLEIPGKTKLHPQKLHQIVLHPSEILRPKTKTPGREIPHGYFLITPGNSTLFFIDPKKSHLLFLQYPWKFHILNPPCLVFFYNSPINAIVKQVSASTYQHFCYQR